MKACLIGRDKKLYEAYRRARTAHVRLAASQAILIARAELKDETEEPLDWRETSARAFGSYVQGECTLERAGYSVHVRLIDDTGDADTSWLGEFEERENYYGRTFDKPSEESIATEYTEYNNGRTYKVWYTPCNTYREARAYYLANKYSRRDAHELARAQVFSDMKRLKKAYEGELAFVGIQARVLVDGEEIAECAVWGFEFAGLWNTEGMKYIDESARDIIAEAETEALELLPERAREAEAHARRLRALSEKGDASHV